MHDFRKLKVWFRCHALTLDVYRETNSLPREERYGLAAQMRRAAVSIESNIAEGSGRSTDADFARFLSLAAGSASELSCQVRIATDLGYLPERIGSAWERELDEITKMLEGLRRRLSS